MSFALTEVMNAGKLAVEPQCSTTNGGDGFFCAMLSAVGTQHDISVSTALTTDPSWAAVASKNISSVILAGSEPLNSGGPAFLAPLAGFRSHLADLVIVTSLGLNWNGSAPRLAPAEPPEEGS